MARPTPDQKRDRQLNIALRQDELDELKARADASGTRLVDYARGVLLNMRVASYSIALPSRLDRLNHEQLKRIGNNLNQIARQLNALGQVSTPELEACLEELRQLIGRVGQDGP
jgi:hypothetical protein